MTYTAFTWTSSTSGALATPISAENLNHLETQYTEVLSHFSTTYIPLAGTATLLTGNPTFPTAAVAVDTTQVATCGFVHHKTRVIIASTSNTVRYSDDTTEDSYSAVPVEIKSCVIPDTHSSGKYTITWDHKSMGSWGHTCRIYIDGVATGTVHTNSENVWYSETTDISIADAGGVSTNSSAKTIQLYLWSDGGLGADVRLFRVKCDHSKMAGY